MMESRISAPLPRGFQPPRAGATQPASDANDLNRRVVHHGANPGEKLRLSEERYRTLFDSAPLALFVCDRDSVIQYFNRCAAELWGREPVCGVEKHCGSVRLLRPDGTHLPHDQTPLAGVLLSGVSVGNVEVMVERPDGSHLPVLVNFAALRDAQGSISGAVTSFCDISERKQTEGRVRQSEAFLQGVITASSDCIKVMDLAGRLTWMSENGRCAMEISELAQFLGADWFSFWRDEETLGQARRAVELACAGAVGHFHGFCPTFAGTPKWWDVTVSPICGAEGAPKSLLAVSRDVTEQKRAEEALKLSEAALQHTLAETETQVQDRTAELALAKERLQQLLQKLAETEENQRRRISRELHDQVGQQLTALMLGMKSLQPHLAAGHLPALRELELIAESVGKEIHDLALELRPTALDDLGLAGALANFFDRWTVRTGVQVVFHHIAIENPRLPAEVETTLFRLVLEALTNVAKHAGASEVSVIVERRLDHVLMIVEDNGRGFDVEAVRNHGAFTRLGLVGMQERAVAAGGTVDIESTPGLGTSLYTRLPLVPALNRHE